MGDLCHNFCSLTSMKAVPISAVLPYTGETGIAIWTIWFVVVRSFQKQRDSVILEWLTSVSIAFNCRLYGCPFQNMRFFNGCTQTIILFELLLKQSHSNLYFKAKCDVHLYFVYTLPAAYYDGGWVLGG